MTKGLDQRSAPRDPQAVLYHLRQLIEAFSGRTVLVIGDLIADEYVYGRVARVSREAPVLILEYDSTEIVPGGAGNAARNVASLGGKVLLATVAGRDEAARRVLGSFSKRIARGAIVRSAAHHTVVKTRILAGGTHSAKQQVVRIDRRAAAPVSDEQRSEVERAALQALAGADAVLVSDYGSGLVRPAFVRQLATAASNAGRKVPVLVDSRYALIDYARLTACTPNESEVEEMLGVRIGDRVDLLERAGRTLLERTRMKAVLITRGSRGMALFEPESATVHIPVHGSDQSVDPTGAGDTVISTLTLALAAGASFEEAARLANYAAGLVVMKRGTATVDIEELGRTVGGDRQAGLTSTRQGYGAPPTSRR